MRRQPTNPQPVSSITVLLICSLAVVMMSCGDFDNPLSNSTHQAQCPSWLHGSWKYDPAQGGESLGIYILNLESNCKTSTVTLVRFDDGRTYMQKGQIIFTKLTSGHYASLLFVDKKGFHKKRWNVIRYHKLTNSKIHVNLIDRKKALRRAILEKKVAGYIDELKVGDKKKPYIYKHHIVSAKGKKLHKFFNQYHNKVWEGPIKFFRLDTKQEKMVISRIKALEIRQKNRAEYTLKVSPLKIKCPKNKIIKQCVSELLKRLSAIMDIDKNELKIFWRYYGKQFYRKYGINLFVYLSKKEHAAFMKIKDKLPGVGLPKKF